MQSKEMSRNNQVPDYVKMYTQETTREIIKARIGGKLFRMADFDKIQADPAGYACEIQRWKTAVKKALKEDPTGIGKKHIFAWGVEDEKPDAKYSDLPENGVPSNKTELMALVTNGRLGTKYMRDETLAATADDTVFDGVIEYLSGGAFMTYQDYMKSDNQEKIMKAMELVRLTLSAALNNEMELVFMRGQYTNFKAVMEWIDIKTECTDKNEYMADLFKGLDSAVGGDGEVDSKCMEFRMAMELLYIDKGIQFKDWEHNDPKAETFEKETYTPATSFLFLWEIYKQMGKERFAEVEAEFKREIGADQYNKEGWMANKPALYKIIKRLSKGKSKAKVASLTAPKDDDDSDDELLIETDDGCVFKVQPKFKGAGNTWKQNFSKRFNLQQSGHNRWQSRQRQQQQYQQQQRQGSHSHRNNNQNSNSNGNNRVEQQKRDTPSSDQLWKCPKCRNNGVTKRFRGDQKCPAHDFRPRFFANIPLAGIRELKPEETTETTGQDANGDGNGQVQAIRTLLYNHSDDSE